MHCRSALLSSFLLGFAQLAFSAEINVVVGGPGVLKFNPSFVNAAVGDVIVFTMKQKNHTVTQSSFESPCVKAVNGIDTGFVPVPDTMTSDFPVAKLSVLGTDPQWLYCKQANHCQQGMVFAINPGDKFAAFLAAATGGASTASSSAPVSTTASATSTPPASSVSSTVSSSATSTPTGVDHRIIVGGPGILAYSPSNISAQVGDTITFEFHQKNHTVTASSFDTPCRALSSTSTTGELGFDSGFIPVSDADTVFPTFTIRVNDTTPIWAYCRQANHCGSGMVFSANAVENGPKNFSAFVDLAKQQNGTTTTPPDTSDAPAAFALSYPHLWISAALITILSF
ncbi:putative GPI-anchored cupredoxin [Psilocybe cubensis]|uniref:GPI-anchored cupredoxin n=2 Tax=Psilocybe cubensis TaxID=181762 RepID=A0ACB8HAH2_PSICU|nr:putative GPI-anchored cupredoxin [Psilocybe cubensis]KAH9484204.1 putative GPI-anchored cupredoxin [Psilocybe cubensis]